MTRSILEPWEVSQDRPSPFEPVKFEQDNIVPFRKPQEYVDYINRSKPQAMHEYDENYRMPGHYVAAEIIDGAVWVTFVPEKLAGRYWVSFAAWRKT